MVKENRNITTMNLQIPLSISMALSKRVCSLREIGIDTTKSSLLISYAQRGLYEDKDGESEPVSDPGLNDNDGAIEVR